MPWEVIIKNAYPEYELYCKDVLRTNHCTPSLEEVIRWYRFIEWWHTQQLEGAPGD
jgi:hypothetical protein